MWEQCLAVELVVVWLVVDLVRKTETLQDEMLGKWLAAELLVVWLDEMLVNWNG